MSDIWHNPPQTPDVFKSHPIIVVYEAGDQIEQMDSKEYSDLVGERYVNRWCYVDELIKENDRTLKALYVATKCINWVIDTFQKGLEHESDVIGCCELSLERIEELEQKDK